MNAIRSLRTMYRGWWIVALAFYSQLITVASGGYVFGVLILGMQHDLGWSQAALFLPLTINRWISGLLSIPLGPVVDRRGSRGLMTISALLAGVGLLGVAYRYGGTSANTGFDCSGLVSHIYAEAYGKKIPPNTKAQSSLGETVSLRELEPGDLVFFFRNGQLFRISWRLLPDDACPSPRALWYASIAQALGVSHPACCSQGGMRNRGTMEPPTAESSSTPKVDARCACWREAASAQAASARPAAIAETSRQAARKAGQCGPISTP